MKKRNFMPLFVGTMVLILMGLPNAGLAEVKINIGVNLPPPPPLVIPAPPPMFVIPGTYVYFAPEVNVDLFFYRGYWYRPYQGHWYRSRSHNGKWVYLSPPKLPHVLLNLPPDFRRSPAGYRHIPYGDLRKNWKRWEREKYWESHGGREWHGERWEHEQGRERGR